MMIPFEKCDGIRPKPWKVSEGLRAAVKRIKYNFGIFWSCRDEYEYRCVVILQVIFSIAKHTAPKRKILASTMPWIASRSFVLRWRQAATLQPNPFAHKLQSSEFYNTCGHCLRQPRTKEGNGEHTPHITPKLLKILLHLESPQHPIVKNANQIPEGHSLYPWTPIKSLLHSKADHCISTIHVSCEVVLAWRLIGTCVGLNLL